MKYSDESIKQKLAKWIVANDANTATMALEHASKLIARKIDKAGILGRMSDKDKLEFMNITTQLMAGSQAQSFKSAKIISKMTKEDDEFKKFIEEVYYENPDVDEYRKEFLK